MYLQVKKTFCLTIPEWGPSKLSSSSSATKNLPKLTGLLPPAAAVLLLPPSASSTGTTVKLVGILTLEEIVLNKVSRVECSVNTTRKALTVEPLTPQGRHKISKGSQVEDIGPQSRKLEIQIDQNSCVFFSLCSVSQCPLDWGWKCCLQHVRQAEVLQCLHSPSLFLSVPSFYPHCSKAIAPCDPLFTIWTESLWLLPLLQSHHSHSHLCNATRQENKLECFCKRTQSIKPTLSLKKTKSVRLVSNEETKSFLFFWH